MRMRMSLHQTAFSLALILSSYRVEAEITLLDGNSHTPQGPGRLNVQVGGSIRPQIHDVMGGKDKGSYQRNVFDGGTRFRFHLNYLLNNDLSWENYYEVGVDLPKLVGWKGHYAKGARNTGRRQLYSGIKSQRWGKLTYGQKNSVYYDVVTSKTDIWSNDLHTEPQSLGADSNYDGSWRARKSLMYEYTLDNVTLYGSNMFNEHPVALENHRRYKRHGGVGLGFNAIFTDNLNWGLAWSSTRATLSSLRSSEKQHVNQQLLGTGVTWNPNQWKVAISTGWYHHFVAMPERVSGSYFAGNAWGASYLIGHKTLLNFFLLKAVMPYYFGAQLRVGSHHQRFQRENGMAIAFYLDKGFSLDFQHVFRSSDDHIGDLNLVRLRYDF